MNFALNARLSPFFSRIPSTICLHFKFVYRSEVLRIERQLEEARGKLTAIRQAKYKLRGSGQSGDESGTSGGEGGFDSYNNSSTR